jgi:hypothetical protein
MQLQTGNNKSEETTFLISLDYKFQTHKFNICAKKSHSNNQEP